MATTYNIEVPPGSISMFAGAISAPVGWLICDGSSISRTTYSNLFSSINTTIGTFTVTIATPAVVTLSGHGLTSGDAIYLNTTGALPTNLSANTLYWVTVINSSTFNLSTSYANYVAGTKIATSGSQSGTHTAIRCPWGLGDGSTTFTLPDLRPTAQGIPNATAAVGGWTAYTPTITNLGSGSVALSFGYWRRVGNVMEIHAGFNKDGVAGSGGGAVIITIPSGYTLDFGTILTQASPVGSADIVLGAAGNFTAGIPLINSSISTTGFFFRNTGTTSNMIGSAILAASTISARVTVPIAQWTTNNNLVTYVIKY
jgi:microcystin-dependent protein